MRKGKIDVTKIDKAHLFKGAKGTYLDVVLIENKNGTDEFGNDGFIAQEVSREARESGIKGPIIGNWRRIKKKADAQKPATAKAPTAPNEDDDIPF